MTQTTARRCTYRKTRNETWAVMGPAEMIVAGAEVTVTKRSGEQKTERIGSVGKVFVKDGQSMRYGYPERRSTGGRRGHYSANWAPRSCQDCQDVEDMSDAMGCARHRGNPRN